MSGPLREKFKELIRSSLSSQATFDTPTYSLASVISLNDDGTVLAADSRGNQFTAFPKYPVVIGQNVILVNDGQGNISAVPVGASVQPTEVIHPPFFSGKIQTLFTGQIGPGAFGNNSLFDNQLDILVQQAGSNKVIAIRARDILKSADYAEALLASQAGTCFVPMAVSTDHRTMAIIYPAYVSHDGYGTPFYVIFLDISGLTAGNVLSAPLGIYAPSAIKIISYNSGPYSPGPYLFPLNPATGQSLATVFVSNFSLASPSLAYLFYFHSIGSELLVTIANLASGQGSDVLGQAGIDSFTIPAYPNGNFVGDLVFGPFQNPLDLRFLLNYAWYLPNYPFLSGTDNANQIFLSIVNAAFDGNSLGILLQLDTSQPYHHTVGQFPGYIGSFTPVYSPSPLVSHTSDSTNGAILQNNLVQTQNSNSENFWIGLYKLDNHTGTPAILNTALLYRGMVSKPPGLDYITLPLDSSIQSGPPSGGIAPNTQRTILPTQMAVINTKFYAIDYSDCDVSGGTYWLPKLYQLSEFQGPLGTTLTLPSIPSKPAPILRNISPGFVDQDAIRLFSKSIDGTGLYQYLNIFKMEMAKP